MAVENEIDDKLVDQILGDMDAPEGLVAILRVLTHRAGITYSTIQEIKDEVRFAP